MGKEMGWSKSMLNYQWSHSVPVPITSIIELVRALNESFTRRILITFFFFDIAAVHFPGASKEWNDGHRECR